MPHAARPSATDEAVHPVAWSPDDLALDTRGLHEAVHRDHAGAAPELPPTAVYDPEVLERAVEDAYARGFAEGRRDGERAEGARLRHAVQAVTDALESLHTEAERWVGNAAENVSALAIAVARQVIGREVALDKSTLSAMVEQALTEFPLDQALTLRVSPQDMQVIHAAFVAQGDASALAARKEIQWLPDPRVAPGGCLIEGRDRIVDGRVDTALERLYRRLTYTGA